MARRQALRRGLRLAQWKRLPICYLLFVLSSIQLSAQSALTTDSVPLMRLAADQEPTSLDYMLNLGTARLGSSEGGFDYLSSFCMTVAPSVDQSILRKLKTEWEIGKRMAAAIEQQQTIIHDPEISMYLNRLERNITRNSDLQGCFNVQVLEDVEANAYSLPGGFLYLTSGLMLVTRSEGELIAALAHETAHVTAHHFLRIQRKRRLWGRLALAGGPAGYFGRRLVGPILTRKLIRNSEFEADRVSLKYESAAGYDPSELSQLLRGAFEDDGEPASFVQRLFDTHPLVTTRIKRLDKASAGMTPTTTNPLVDTSEFHMLKERLSRLLKFVVIPATDPKTPSHGTPQA